MNVAIFNGRWRKAIPVESTVKTVRRNKTRFIAFKLNAFIMSFSELLGLSKQYHAKPRFQELQSRLGNQSGCENSLSYIILILNFVTVKDDPSLLNKYECHFEFIRHISLRSFAETRLLWVMLRTDLFLYSAGFLALTISSCSSKSSGIVFTI